MIGKIIAGVNLGKIIAGVIGWGCVIIVVVVTIWFVIAEIQGEADGGLGLCWVAVSWLFGGSALAIFGNWDDL